MLSRLTCGLTSFCARHAFPVLSLFIFLCLGAGWLSYEKLGITTETDKLFSDTLPWKHYNHEIERLFPGEKDTLVAIIKADTPEEGQATAHALTEQLKRDTTHFNAVSEPAANPFYTQHALLFLDKPQLQSLLDSIISAQPFLGTLSADPSLTGLFQSFSLLSMGIKSGQTIPESFNKTLGIFAQTLDEASRGKTAPLSWQNLLAGDLTAMGGDYYFVMTHPKRDFTSFEPSEAATKAMRAVLNTLPTVKAGRASALITGEAKLNDEEFSTVAEGMVWGLIISLALVTLWLILAVRSIRVIIPILMTLITGLILTTGFAALSVGTLNLISVAFAILFVGIAVDFAIQFGVRFRCQHGTQGEVLSPIEALAHTGAESGPQIFIASLATAAGFMAFTPTHFVGVAQLGLIAGIGMLIAFACTLTILPALLIIFRAHSSIENHGFRFLKPLDKGLRHYRFIVLGLFGIAGAVGLGLTSQLHFDSDPLHTKNPNTEGMRALRVLEANPLTTFYNAQLIVKDESTAAKQAQALSRLPSVHDVLWIGALVPEDQNEKLAMIEDAASLLLPSLMLPQTLPAPDAQAMRNAAIKTAGQLDEIAPDKLTPAMKQLKDALHRLGTSSDDQILAANRAMMQFLPTELQQLRTVLHPTVVTSETIPSDIRKEYVSPDGLYRLVIHPKGQMSEPATLHKFVNELKTVNPDIAGPALEITESARTITHAFTEAALCAIIVIAIILVVALRRLGDSLLVITPLILSSLLTVILITSVPEPLNYANIIALPLLLGVGVSFNIYFVMNWRAGLKYPLTSPTARAVIFSALTTGSAFGSLAASAHPGTASMGRLLLLSLGCTLLCTLLFIPALLPKRPQDER
ncbi:MMPL family transporter [Acetobacteraceae bacterium ESL0709]|nr:MMPL family transporter [Acetobacteraceae bacterium ESL0697]MDF7678959.1 MMPL family transporter [Acetobacteraceae bacterium ESL0709]